MKTHFSLHANCQHVSLSARTMRASLIIPSALLSPFSSFFFFNDTATTEIYTLSLHDALPIYRGSCRRSFCCVMLRAGSSCNQALLCRAGFHTMVARHAHHFGHNWQNAELRANRSEEHTSELQSRPHLVCRLLLEKKKKKEINN